VNPAFDWVVVGGSSRLHVAAGHAKPARKMLGMGRKTPFVKVTRQKIPTFLAGMIDAQERGRTSPLDGKGKDEGVGRQRKQ
jgi:hypothetical protein